MAAWLTDADSVTLRTWGRATSTWTLLLNWWLGSIMNFFIIMTISVRVYVIIFLLLASYDRIQSVVGRRNSSNAKEIDHRSLRNLNTLIVWVIVWQTNNEEKKRRFLEGSSVIRIEWVGWNMGGGWQRHVSLIVALQYRSRHTYICTYLLICNCICNCITDCCPTTNTTSTGTRTYLLICILICNYFTGCCSSTTTTTSPGLNLYLYLYRWFLLNKYHHQSICKEEAQSASTGCAIPWCCAPNTIHYLNYLRPHNL